MKYYRIHLAFIFLVSQIHPYIPKKLFDFKRFIKILI